MITTTISLDRKTLATALRTKRADTGLRGAASKIGNVSASSLSRIEHRSMPDLLTYARICRWLGVPMESFLCNGAPPAAASPPSFPLGGHIAPQPAEVRIRAEFVVPADSIAAITQAIRAVSNADQGRPRPEPGGIPTRLPKAVTALDAQLDKPYPTNGAHNDHHSD